MNSSGNIFLGLCAALSLAAGVGRAETDFWSDNFDTNAASRWTTNSIWRIGSPTIGPATNSGGYRTYSGTNCATTGLNSSAPANADARLVCTNYNGSTNLMIPSANQFPRLRFWQWYDFVNALGYVEINTGSGWQPISSTNISVGSTASTSSGVWSRPSIDLSAFAGQSVQIAFHFASGGSGYGSDPGWYVDDVAVVTNEPVFNNPEGFEAGLGDWSVDAGTWEVGVPTSGPATNSAGYRTHSGTNCAATVLAGNYGWNVDTRLISPPFLVPSSGNQALRFWQWYNFVNAGGFVEINTGTTNITGITNSTIIYTNIITYTTNITVTTTNIIASTNSIPFATNTTVIFTESSWQSISQTNKSVGGTVVTSGGWTNAVVDLSAYSGQTVQVAFHFQSGGSGYGNAPGWYVDDLSLVATPVLTVPGTQAIYAGQTLMVTNYATLFPGNGTPVFALVSGPTDVDLNTNTGVLTWVTSFAQPSGTYTNVIMVTDNNSPPLSATNSFLVVVTNPWVPVLTVPPTQTLYAGQTLVVTNYATNNFFPNDTFTFGLLPPYPPGINLDTNTGVLSWATTTGQVGTNTFFITVLDNVLQLSATNSFIVELLSPPSPVLTVPPTQAIYAGQTLVVTNYATNSVFPNCTFTFGIVSAPAGVSINPTSGVLAWTPTAAQAPSINSISVKVMDNNSPPLSAIANFSVLVSPTPPPVLTVPPTQIIYAGQTLVVTNYATNSILTNCTFTFGIVSPPAGVSIDPTSGVLTWTNTAPWVLSTNTIFVFVTNNCTLLEAANNFTVIILPNPPVLKISAANGFQLTFDTFSNVTWQIEASTNLLSTNLLDWLPLSTNTAGPSGTIQFTDLLATNYPWRFYRAVLQ
jgi:hypothetical protein